MDWVRKCLVRVTVGEPIHPLEIFTVLLHLPATPREIADHLQAEHVMFLVSTSPDG